MLNEKKFSLQGHRGARGLFPENTVTAFIEAVKLGVDTLELDVVISKDFQVVVSHEAWMNSIFCTRPDGLPVENNSKEKYNLFKMNYSEIVKYDCGTRTNPEFPSQKSIAEHKPLLSEVFAKVDAYINENNFSEINYNIEIKSEPEEDGIFNPAPKTFVELVYNEIVKCKMNNRVNVQSFDVRILQEMKNKDASLPMALLVENNDSLEINLQRLGFLPNTYSPDFCLVNETLVKKLHNKNIKLIPWTVNEITDMQRLIQMGVDGIITDYPNRLIDLLKK